MTLLHISASPRGEASESLAIARSFLDAFRDANPAASVEEWDLWDGSLPSFGPDGAGAKMRIFAGDQPVGPQETAWHRARLAFERFAAADLYVVRADFRFKENWEGLIEGRLLDMPNLSDKRSGTLVVVSRRLNEHFKVGAGYNFTDFSDDLTDLSFDHRGLFLNMTGAL